MKTWGTCALLSLLTLTSTTFAHEKHHHHHKPFQPNGIFFGLGGGYNSVRADQHIFASGISDVFLNGVQVASGEAGGPASPYYHTENSFAPLAQIGFITCLDQPNWSWGMKFQYEYLGLTATNNVVDVPQFGSFESNTNDTFTGNVIIQSAQLEVNHELELFFFLAHSFRNHSQFYLGAGPAVFATKPNVYHAIGYADINGTHADISGQAVNYTNSKWMWGGAGQVGLTHYFSRSWFMDLNYTFAVTGKYTVDDSSPFSSETDGYTDTGTLFVNTSNRIIVQGVSLSFNKLFS